MDSILHGTRWTGASLTVVPSETNPAACPREKRHLPGIVALLARK